MGPYCPFGATPGHLEPNGADMCSHSICWRFQVSTHLFVVAKGGSFADFVLMAQSRRRICEACLFTKGVWGTGTVGGGMCKHGRGRYWNSARCRLIVPEANTILGFPVLNPVHCYIRCAILCLCGGVCYETICGSL